jgi:hypothetical protein
VSPEALEYDRRSKAYDLLVREAPHTVEADAAIDAECGALDVLWYSLSESDRIELNMLGWHEAQPSVAKVEANWPELSAMLRKL